MKNGVSVTMSLYRKELQYTKLYIAEQKNTKVMLCHSCVCTDQVKPKEQECSKIDLCSK